MSLHTWYKRKYYWMTDIVNGGGLWRSYRDVKLASSDSPQGHDRRLRMLEDILDFAKTNIPYYKRAGAENFIDFPVINKTTILSERESFLTPYDIIPGQKGPVHIQKTSGSTGTPFEIPQDTLCRLRRLATIKYENDLIGFRTCEPLLQLRSGIHYWGKFTDRYDSKSNILYFDNSILDEKRINTVIDLINKRKIKYIRSYMTSIDIITRYAIEHGMELIHHPFFISVGEGLLDSVRLRVCNELGCHIISQYGNEENGVLGSSSIDGSGKEIKLNRCSTLVEIIKHDSDQRAEKGETGRVVVTDLSNHAMPMIRYDTGDIAVAGEVDTLGFATSISNLMGRKTDLIVNTEGVTIDFFNKIPSYIFNNRYIRQFQFIQSGKTDYMLLLNMMPGKSIDENGIIHDFKIILGQDALIDILYTDSIPVMSSGKRKIIVNNYRP